MDHFGYLGMLFSESYASVLQTCFGSFQSVSILISLRGDPPQKRGGRTCWLPRFTAEFARGMLLPFGACLY
jgi:hypothetical protein